MKKAFTFLCLVLALQVSAQSNKSNVFSVNIQKEVKPAILGEIHLLNLRIRI